MSLTSAMKQKALGAALGAAVILGPRAASAEVPLAQFGGWQFSTDGRVNAFISVANGNGLPAQEPDFAYTGTEDQTTSTNQLNSTRIRNGFLMSILGFTAVKEVNKNFKVTARVGIWMNASGSRTQNVSGLVDPRELYVKIEGGWGSVLGGSDLSLFGRGGILVDFKIAHEYGMGYPCSVQDASGGACGMVAYGAIFPGYNPGFVYTTPDLAGFKVALGIYDPATIDNAQLDRAPLPRFEGEISYEWKNIVRVFGSGLWQVMEGTVQNTGPGGGEKDLHVEGWGAQAGAMLTLGPIMLGGAAYEGAGFSPFAALDESQISANSAGVLRNSHGVFGLGAVVVKSLNAKVAGGLGVWHLDKNKDDSGIMDSTGAPANPQLIEENLGATIGIYQNTDPVHFALEYFRAQSTWYPLGVASPTNPQMTVGQLVPHQAVNFVNAGMTVTW